jgi:hypothetical protein
VSGIGADDLVVGVVYDVLWEDCCAGGEFTSALEVKVFDVAEPDFLDVLVFANGVRLTSSLWGYQFTEAS